MVQVIDGPEIQEVMFDNALLKQYVQSLYKCNYDAFLQSLGMVSVSRNMVIGCGRTLNSKR